MYVSMYVCMYVCICSCVRMSACMCTNRCVCICVFFLLARVFCFLLLTCSSREKLLLLTSPSFLLTPSHGSNLPYPKKPCWSCKGASAPIHNWLDYTDILYTYDTYIQTNKQTNCRKKLWCFDPALSLVFIQFRGRPFCLCLPLSLSLLQCLSEPHYL